MRPIRNSLCLMLAFLLASSLPNRALAEDEALDKNPPNILFILTEDQGAHLSALGTVGLRTPHIDSLAREGVLFNQAFVDAPVCSASKAAIYTGLHAHSNGIPTNTMNFFRPASKLTEAERNNSLYNFRRVPENVPTLIEILKAANYYTRVTDKLHVAPNHKFPYDEWGATSAESAKKFIETAGSLQRPWFLWYNIRDPHRKFTDSDKHPIRVDPQDVEVPAFLPDTPVVRQDIAEYYDAIERADDKVGAVLAVLSKNRSKDNTLVIFMGDHGPSFQRGKMAPYDYGLRVPLLFAGPNVENNIVSDKVVGAIDLMPTLLEVIGITPPLKQHGKSLKPILEGNSNAFKRDYIVSEVQHQAQQHDEGMRERSIYDGRYRLIYRDKPSLPRDVNADIVKWPVWGNRTYAETILNKEKFSMQYELLRQIDNEAIGGSSRVLELYDTKNDPDEIKDLINDPSMAKVKNRLMQSLMKWAKQTGDPLIMQVAHHSQDH